MDILLGLSPAHQECPPKRVKANLKPNPRLSPGRKRISTAIYRPLSDVCDCNMTSIRIDVETTEAPSDDSTGAQLCVGAEHRARLSARPHRMLPGHPFTNLENR